MKPKDYPQKINLEELIDDGWISFGKGSAVGLNMGYLELMKRGRNRIVYNSKKEEIFFRYSRRGGEINE